MAPEWEGNRPVAFREVYRDINHKVGMDPTNEEVRVEFASDAQFGTIPRILSRIRNYHHPSHAIPLRQLDLWSRTMQRLAHEDTVHGPLLK